MVFLMVGEKQKGIRDRVFKDGFDLENYLKIVFNVFWWYLKKCMPLGN